ncbi:MAG: hypothetical protein EPO42_05590 [Gallionellaceae bacterium]|nr:MAG: hypothetical protein EPO42_05590 [Gallionellaceae bacterium]
MTQRISPLALCLCGIIVTSNTYASCGSTACAINTNWDEHSASKPGLSMDLRYSYSQADQLRSGSSKIAADTTFAGEVENLRTLNKIVAAGIDYTHDAHWGLALSIPYVAREHSHNLGPYTGAAPAGNESFTANALGDIKLVGRYRWALNDAEHTGVGIKFGLKLNTGRQDFQMVDNLGASKLPGEVTLQPGNGSTDLIAGVFWQQANPGSALSWFAQGMAQSAIKNKTEFKPGNQFNLDGGMRYAVNNSLSGLLQLNAQWNDADSGISAALTASGTPSSGGKSYSLTPGLSYTIVPGTNVYGLVQLPLYQYVNGEQLTASNSVTAGINHRF